MTQKFDGCEVEVVNFSDVCRYGRFFTDNGVGYTKTSRDSCCDDYSMRQIAVDPTSTVWVKKRG